MLYGITRISYWNSSSFFLIFPFDPFGTLACWGWMIVIGFVWGPNGSSHRFHGCPDEGGSQKR